MCVCVCVCVCVCPRRGRSPAAVSSTGSTIRPPSPRYLKDTRALQTRRASCMRSMHGMQARRPTCGSSTCHPPPTWLTSPRAASGLRVCNVSFCLGCGPRPSPVSSHSHPGSTTPQVGLMRPLASRLRRSDPACEGCPRAIPLSSACCRVCVCPGGRTLWVLAEGLSFWWGPPQGGAGGSGVSMVRRPPVTLRPAPGTSLLLSLSLVRSPYRI